VFGMEKLDEFKVFSIRNLNHQYILYMEPAFEEMLFNVKEDPFLNYSPKTGQCNKV
jgi:hypothetical protein